MNKKPQYAIIGLGVTGLSCAKYLAKNNVPFVAMDTRENPPNLQQFENEYPNAKLVLGGLDEGLLDSATDLVISPGISLETPLIKKQVQSGKSIIGDIEMFAREVNAPVIAITGTNAKSTVTSLVGEMAANEGLKVKVGGNLGIPALDLIDESVDVYVLELSSFQLERVQSLNPKVATVLNVSPDHLDRYSSFDEYAKVKKYIYNNCEVAVCNGDDSLTDCGTSYEKAKLTFISGKPKDQEFGLIEKNQQTYLAHGDELLMQVAELPKLGGHFKYNALAALAVGCGFGFSISAMIKTLKDFKGLEHRCQLVKIKNGVFWYNDSKGTNIGATIAAIEGLGPEAQGKLILIAGGIGKNADFKDLAKALNKHVTTLVLIGEDAKKIAEVASSSIDIKFADSMQNAVEICHKAASSGDIVLLSPACASFDMFKDFEHRGQVFTEIVEQL